MLLKILMLLDFLICWSRLLHSFYRTTRCNLPKGDKHKSEISSIANPWLVHRKVASMITLKEQPLQSEHSVKCVYAYSYTYVYVAPNLYHVNLFIFLRTHCVKHVHIRSFFWSEYRKIRTRKTPYLDTSHAVAVFVLIFNPCKLL